MSQPSVLSPWYAVQRLVGDQMEYYQSAAAEGEPLFTSRKKEATLFMSLHAASRVALAEVAEVRVLFDSTQVREFGRS